MSLWGSMDLCRESILYRKAVTARSPGLPRFAATLGSNGENTPLPQRGCGSREIFVTRWSKGRCLTTLLDLR